MEKNKLIKSILNIVKESAIILLVFIGINVLLTSILFLCHISISNINFGLSLIFTIMFILYFYKTKDRKEIIIASIVAIIVFMCSIFVCSHTYDLTWDGNTYHKLAVGMMKDGWNPAYQSAKSFMKDTKTDFKIKDADRNSIWIQHYPKASWIFAANMYSVTNSIESSKILTLLFLYIGFCIFFDFCYRKTSLAFSILISILLVINPISVTQTLNYYIDGLMGICIYIILCSLMTLSEKGINEESKRENLLILAISLLICINLKFTGLVYSAIFCFMFFMLWMYRAYKDDKLKEKFIYYLKYFGTIVFVSVVIVGFSSYVKNTFSKGNPLYPLMGKNKEDIISYNQPSSFQYRNSLNKFFTSMFSKQDNIQSTKTDKDPTLKIPFTIYTDELTNYIGPDMRISGFGVWFSGIFVLSLCFLVFFLYKIYRKNEYEKFGLLLAFISISFLLVLITDGSWWARYVPYIYLFPIISVYIASKEEKTRYKIIAGVLCFALLVNVGIMSYTTYKKYSKEYSEIRIEMKNITKISRSNKEVKIALYTKAFSSLYYNLRDNNIVFKDVKDVKKLKNPKFVNYFFYER